MFNTILDGLHHTLTWLVVFVVGILTFKALWQIRIEIISVVVLLAAGTIYLLTPKVFWWCLFPALGFFYVQWLEDHPWY